MMLIPPALNIGNTDANASKDKYFNPAGVYPINPVSSTPGSSELSPESSGSRTTYQSPPIDGRMFAPKMQSDLPGFHMHAAAAVVTGQPGSFPLNSPANYAAGAAAAPAHSIVPTHYGSTAIDPASYYSPLSAGYDMKGGDMWNGGYNQPTHPYYQYDSGFGPQYPYERCYAMEMNDGVRRKNATRESTNTLKAWLQEHKKNPYPTKGEKIMLAIITKMTLTQVSTWFANARRRLKKENKMTWVPKNRANESGSGTEERRQSDDKDSDEKSDDEDCKSDKEDNDQNSEGKVDTDQEGNASCQYDQQNSTSLSYTARAQNPTETQTDSGTEMAKAKPGTEYGRMIGSDIPCANANMPPNTNPSLSEKIHSANMVQNPAPMRYEAGHDGFNRPIWSPIDSHGQKNLNLPSRPYHHSGFAPEYHLQTGYPTDSDGRRLSSTNPQPYPTNYDVPPTLLQQQLGGNPQEALSLHSQTSTSHLEAKMYSPMSSEGGTKQLNGPPQEGAEISQMDPSRRNEYPYTSPVTNLRNYVNGVFHGPSSQTPASGLCVKNPVMQAKSPNSTNENTVVSPGGAHPYQHHYDQAYLHHRHSHSVDAPMSVEPYMLHRTLSGPYGSYYNDAYHSQGIPDSSQQHSGGSTYYSHQTHATPSRSLTAEAASAEGTRPNSSSTQDGYSTTPRGSVSQQQCQSSPSSCQRGTPEDNRIERRPSACMPYYDSTMESSGLPARSSVPPPPYASQCKFGAGTGQAQTFIGPHSISHRQASYDGVNPASNQSATSHSPRGIQTGIQAHEGSGYGCTVTTVPSDDEEMRTMQPSEPISDKASR